MIGERRSAILGLIIDYYIKTGEPMGSKTLCDMLPYTISSATIRNEMAALTTMGFLEQRHTSGGRVPTNASYRYYVDNLIMPVQLSLYEKQKIDEILSVNASDPERLLSDASKLLSKVTGCASFFNTIKDPFDCIQSVELMPAGNNRAMLVMLTVGGKIKSSVIKLRCPINHEFKIIFYGLVNEFFIGVPLNEIDLTLIQTTAPALGIRISDMLPVLSSLCSLCREAANGTFEVNGETKLLSQAELGDNIYDLLTLLAERKKLEALLTGFARARNATGLFLGDENPMHELKNTSMAVAKYRYNNDQIATLGIIGSLRIDYGTVLPRTDYIMKKCATLLKEGGI